MGSKGVKPKVVSVVLTGAAVPIVLFSLAMYVIDSAPGRLMATVVFLFLAAVGSYVAARKVIDLLRRSYDRERDLEMQIIQKDKLAAIGLLTAGIAHELNTPLASALLNTQMLKEDAKKEWPDRTPVLTSIEEEIKRLIRRQNIRDFSRQIAGAVRGYGCQLRVDQLLDITSSSCSEKGILIRACSPFRIPCKG